jgi:hypothetical protein
VRTTWNTQIHSVWSKCNFYIFTFWGCVTYRRGMDWLLDLLTCIHRSELHYTDHWHTENVVLSLLQSPLAVSWQRLLPREIPQLSELRRSCHSRPYITLVNWQLQLTTNSLLQTVVLITFRHGPQRKQCFHCYSPTIPRPLHSSGCCLQSHRLATGLHATVC